MRILVYKGGAQYNAMNRFSEQLGAAFTSFGHEVDYVDLLKLQDTKGAELNAALQQKPNLAIGFNGMGSDLKRSDGHSLYEPGALNYLGLLLDHPAFHTGRVVRAGTGTVMGVVDQSHIDYLRDIHPHNPVFFAPHGGIQDENYKNTDRPINILFCGTGLDAQKERKEWSSFPISYQSIMEEAYEEFMLKPQAWDKLIARGAIKRNIFLPTHLMAAMIVQLEIVMRADYRFKILNKLDKAGLKVTIMGNGWEYAKFKHHELHPSVEFYEALKLMTQSKVSLNASPQFFNGTHERVFASMLNGAIPMTSASQYYVEHFKEGEHYLHYELPTLGEEIEKLKTVLASPTLLANIRKHAVEISMRDHTWKSRATEFMDKLQTIGVCQYLYKKQWF